MARNKASIGDASSISRTTSIIPLPCIEARTIRSARLSTLQVVSYENSLRSSRVTAGCAKLVENAFDQLGRGCRRVAKLVVEAQGLPLEGAHLVEGQHLDPLDILHRRQEMGDAGDIGWIVA